MTHEQNTKARRLPRRILENGIVAPPASPLLRRIWLAEAAERRRVEALKKGEEKALEAQTALRALP